MAPENINCCFKYRIRINRKIVGIILLALTFTITPLLLHATTTQICFAQNCVICEMELRCKSVYYN